VTPERWKKLEVLFHEALGLEGKARAAYLAQACGSDERLREEVERLLAAHDRESSFIDSPILAETAGLTNADRHESLIGRQIGPYKVVSLLGRGGMGEVYRALDTRLGREVAIKLLPAAFSSDRDRLRRFEQEARAAGMLNHPNVLTIYDIGRHENAPYIVSELLTGETLREWLRGGPLPMRRAVDCALQIARGLAAAHEKGIVHRDLKPENLLLTKGGRVKILDFGLAKLKPAPTNLAPGIETNASTHALGTAPGVLMGTVGYMSPEQVRAEEVDHRSDIFAFGAILYEMLYGRRAFQGVTAVEILNAILKEEPPEMAAAGHEIPQALRRVMRRCLEKDPAERFQSISDVAFYFETLVGTDDSTSTSSFQTVDQPGNNGPLARIGRIGQIGQIGRIGRIGRIGWIIAAGTAAVALFLLYSRQQPGSLPAEATIKQLTNYTGAETSSALSPDGRYFAFVSEKGGAPDIWVRQVSGGDPLQITRDDAVESELTYAPDGETIYYASEDAIWRIGALGSPARKVVPDAISPSLSADGKYLAYLKGIPGTANRRAIEIANADGSAQRRLHEGLGISDAKLSPDNRWIAYCDGGLFERKQLKLVDVRNGETRTILSDAKGSVWAMAWLPDSRRLVVSRTYELFPLTNTLDLELVSIDGGAPRRLTLNLNSRFTSPSLSSDGRRLLVTMSQQQREIWMIPLGPDPKANGASARRLLDSSWDPIWLFVSRDGRTILFNSRATGSSNLWTMPVDGSAPPRQITAFPGNTVMHSSLSPDGARIAYASNQTGNSEIWVINVDGSNPVQITHDPGEDFWPFWSPDGAWLAFGSLRGGDYRIWKVPAGGGQAVRVSDEPAMRGDWIGDRLVLWGNRAVAVIEAGTGRVLQKIQMREWTGTLPVWNPDGRRFTAIRSDGSASTSIWIFDAENGDRHPAVEFPGRFQAFFRVAWGKDAKSLIVNRNETVSHIGLIENF
jgi:serine/threonine protein kinase/Tol biopolymer transport system component